MAERLVDGAAVDSLVYDRLVETTADIDAKTRIIARWGPYGIPPVVVNPSLDAGLKHQLRTLMLDLHNSPEGMVILNSLGIDKFVSVSDATYDSIREMKAELGW